VLPPSASSGAAAAGQSQQQQQAVPRPSQPVVAGEKGGGLLGCLCMPFARAVGGGGSSRRASVAPAPPSGWGLTGKEAHVWVMPPPEGSSKEELGKRAQALMNEPSVKAAFAKFDADGSGSVDATEIGEILKAAGAEVSQEELSAMMARLDNNGDGDLDILELCEFLLERRDEIQMLKDQKFMIQESFGADVWGPGCLGSGGEVGVHELRSVFMRQLGPQPGLTETEFGEFLAEFGLTPDSTARIALDTLRKHEAFEHDYEAEYIRSLDG